MQKDCRRVQISAIIVCQSRNCSLKMLFLTALHISRKGSSRLNATICDLFLLGLIVLSLSTSAIASDDCKEWKGKGSTRNLKEIIMGRCFDYLETINPSTRGKSCSEIWESFLKAFSGKDPCNIRKEDYGPFLKLADHDIPVNQSIFWSRTKELLFKFTDVTKKFMPLESTLTGYLLNGLDWCGTACRPGLNYESCPEWNECENNAQRSFWRAASENYAAKARGEVSVMLNGSTNVNAFRKTSIFGEIELANLDLEKVTSVHLWIIDSINGPDKESCGVGSVAELESILQEKNVNYTCKDNYGPVQMLQCVNKLDNPSCKLPTTLSLQKDLS
ncbi:ADP-ribosyl cyclase/cyclic ADP-ribose hydrolase 1 [Pristis pectinata]|uniref:ADP-ribosyl cyclase/cyclic ADP-ribose hydrolase 1 n=1 Tax=Pristis pectinata TaxID=685728 RepID=UPI00223CB2E5|nr:ADP-ribosyl cyclase/cyclic ADP-ribose hydrolase 1 [Pristis pectinata]